MGTIINLPIQMIASCSTQGEFTPLRFRYEDEEHNLVTVQIAAVLTHRVDRYNGIQEIVYTCRANLFGESRMFDIKYNVLTHRFSIYQMLS